jgi:hypothetical protein
MVRLDTGEGERLAAAIFAYLEVDDTYHRKHITVESSGEDVWLTWESRAYMTREEFAAFFNDLHILGGIE